MSATVGLLNGCPLNGGVRPPSQTASMTAHLTKIDVARRQLSTAVCLLFDGGDVVSVYSLAANAWEVIDTLCVRAGVDGISGQTKEHLAPGKSLKFDYVNSPYRNFFKHADRGPDAVLEEIPDSEVDSLIFLAVEDYMRLMNKSPVEFQVFQLWYLALHVEKVADGSLGKIIDAVNSTFSNIRELPRASRISFAHSVLEGALNDQSLLADPRTEVSISMRCSGRHYLSRSELGRCTSRLGMISSK